METEQTHEHHRRRSPAEQSCRIWAVVAQSEMRTYIDLSDAPPSAGGKNLLRWPMSRIAPKWVVPRLSLLERRDADCRPRFTPRRSGKGRHRRGARERRLPSGCGQ
jgi:hypothetical protein